MQHIRNLSLLILIAGLILAILAIAADLGPAATLVGLLLIVAGVVKIITVRIWHEFFEAEAPTANLKGTPTHE